VTRQAAERWSSIITADLPDVAADGILIDDMDIVVQWGLLGGAPNGPSGILANAGPTGFRDNGQGLPFRGVSGINPFYADTSTEAQRLALLDTMTHEFGHVMGFSPGANVFGRWIVGNTFTGPNAVREYNELFGVTVNSVPLQANVRAHWDEACGTPAGISSARSRSVLWMTWDTRSTTWRPNHTSVPPKRLPPALRCPVVIFSRHRWWAISMVTAGQTWRRSTPGASGPSRLEPLAGDTQPAAHGVAGRNWLAGLTSLPVISMAMGEWILPDWPMAEPGGWLATREPG